MSEGEAGSSVAMQENNEGESTIPPVPEVTKLSVTSVMELCAYWYSVYGPYRALYSMVPRHAKKLRDLEWTVQFTVVPDTAVMYNRIFTFDRNDKGTFEAVAWREDERRPDEEYDPDEFNSEDDLDTLQEEEMLAAVGGEHNENEVAELEEDNDLSVAELMRKYGYPEEAIAAALAAEQNGGHEEQEETPTGSKRKKRQAAADDETDRGTSDERRRKRKRKRQRKRAEASDGADEQGDEAAAAAAARGVEAGRAAADQAPDTVGTASAEQGSTEGTGAAADDGQTLAGQGTSVVHVSVDDEESSDEEYVVPQNRGVLFSPGGTAIRFQQVKESRVGHQFQANNLPAVELPGDPLIVPQIGEEDKLATLTCTPHPDGLPGVDDLMRLVSQGREKADRYQEYAYALLHRLDNDAHLAVDTFQLQPPAEMYPCLTEEEAAAFERGLVAFSKNFFNIQKHLVPTKTVAQLVDYYYFWKRTPRCDAFYQSGGTLGGYRRTKMLFEPGRDVRKFPARDASPVESDDDDDFSHQHFRHQHHGHLQQAVPNADTAAQGTPAAAASSDAPPVGDATAKVPQPAEPAPSGSAAPAPATAD